MNRRRRFKVKKIRKVRNLLNELSSVTWQMLKDKTTDKDFSSLNNRAKQIDSYLIDENKI